MNGNVVYQGFCRISSLNIFLVAKVADAPRYAGPTSALYRGVTVQDDWWP